MYLIVVAFVCWTAKMGWFRCTYEEASLGTKSGRAARHLFGRLLPPPRPPSCCCSCLASPRLAPALLLPDLHPAHHQSTARLGDTRKNPPWRLGTCCPARRFARIVNSRSAPSGGLSHSSLLILRDSILFWRSLVGSAPHQIFPDRRADFLWTQSLFFFFFFPSLRDRCGPHRSHGSLSSS